MTPLQKNKLQNNITDWLRSNNPNPDLEDPTLLALSSFSGASPSISVNKKKEIVDNAVNWIRNNDVKPEDFEEEILPAFSKMAGLPPPLPALSVTRR